MKYRFHSLHPHYIEHEHTQINDVKNEHELFRIQDNLFSHMIMNIYIILIKHYLLDNKTGYPASLGLPIASLPPFTFYVRCTCWAMTRRRVTPVTVMPSMFIPWQSCMNRSLSCDCFLRPPPHSRPVNFGSWLVTISTNCTGVRSSVIFFVIVTYFLDPFTSRSSLILFHSSHVAAVDA